MQFYVHFMSLVQVYFCGNLDYMQLCSLMLEGLPAATTEWFRSSSK